MDDPKCSKWFKYIDKDNINQKNKIISEFNKNSILGFWPNRQNIDISKVSNLSHMFDFYSNLERIPKINTSQTIDMSYMFKGCKLLEYLPEDLSYWKTENVKDISHMFEECTILKSLPDLSKWNTKNIHDINSVFKGNESLLSNPFLSKWKLDNLTNMSNIFEGCSSLNSLCDISEWNIKKVTDMN